MKNQYFGDVGDFGKYGLLSALLKGPITLGVNWYLTKDDTQTDGKYTEYLNKSEFASCDQELHKFLNDCVTEDRRNVGEIKKLERFKNVLFYDAILDIERISGLSESGRIARKRVRETWFKSSIEDLSGYDLIFCDPDNGIETKSLSRTGKDSVKYVYISEIERMVDSGFSLIIYNHRDRSPDDLYKSRIREFYQSVSNKTKMRVLRFNRYSVRDYIVLMQREQLEVIDHQLDEFLCNDKWKRHFEEIDI